MRMHAGRWLAGLLLLPLLAVPTRSDVVFTKDRKKYEGRILEETDQAVTIRTYADGTLTVPRDEIRRIRKGPSKFDDYEEQIEKKVPETGPDHLSLGNWCRREGLLDLAREHWRKAVDLDPSLDAAWEALGYIKEGGEWISEEEWHTARGHVKHDGEWVTPEEAQRRKRERVRDKVKEVIDMTITFKPDAPDEQMESWIEKVEFWAEVIWDMTGGHVWIATAQITDKSEEGHCVVVNLDKLNIDDKGSSGRARTGRHKFWVGGLCTVFVFVHEFFHAWAGVPDHYGTKIQCLMNSSERGRIYQWRFCDPCWRKVQSTWDLPFRPGFVADEKLPGDTSPGEHGRPKDYPDFPGVDVTVGKGPKTPKDAGNDARKPDKPRKRRSGGSPFRRRD